MLLVICGNYNRAQRSNRQKQDLREGLKEIIGKHCLCATINKIFSSSVIVYFGGVLLVDLVLLVTWVIRTPNPLNHVLRPTPTILWAWLVSTPGHENLLL